MFNKKQLSQVKKVFTFALPITASGLINIISNIVAMLMVSHLGHDELAASALAFPTNITLLTLVVTPLYAVGILTGHHFGKKSHSKEIGNIVRNGFYLGLLLFIPTGFLLWHAGDILHFFNQDPALVALAIPFFHYAALTLFPVVIYTVILQFFTGIGKPRFSLVVTLILLPMIIFFSYAFIFGNFGFPKLGLAGVTCASFLAQSIGMVGILIYLFLQPNIKQYSFFNKSWLPQWSEIKKIFNMGFPIGLQFGGELSAMSVATYFMGLFKVHTIAILAAVQIVSQCSMLMVIVTLGLSQALSILVSQAYGSKSIQLARDYFSASIAIILSFWMFIVILFALFHLNFFDLYLHDVSKKNHDLIIYYANYFLLVAGIGLLLDSLRNLLSGALRGLHDTKGPTHIGIACQWLVSLPLCYLVGFTLGGGPVALRLTFFSGFALAAYFLWIRFNKKTSAIKLEFKKEEDEASQEIPPLMNP